MCGVAGDQYPAGAPPVCDQAVEAIDGSAFDLDRPAVPGADQALGDAFVHHRLRRLAGEHHELPAMPPRSAQDAGGRAGGIAELDVDVRRAATRRDLHVNHEPGLVELVVEQAPADRLAHRARGAVAADQILGAEVRGAGWCRDGSRHAIGVLHKGVELLAESDVGAGQGGEPLAQNRLQARLVEHITAAPAGWRLSRRLQFHENASVGGAEFVVRQVARALPHLLGDSELLEDAHDLVVEVYRAGQGVGRRVLLDRDHPRAALGQQRRQHRSRRSETDHQHVAIDDAHLRVR